MGEKEYTTVVLMKTILVDYDIRTYGGTKSIVLSGTSFLGARNPFMGLAYIIMGCACAFLGVVFLGWHFFRPRYVEKRMHDQVDCSSHMIYTGNLAITTGFHGINPVVWDTKSTAMHWREKLPTRYITLYFIRNTNNKQHYISVFFHM